MPAWGAFCAIAALVANGDSNIQHRYGRLRLVFIDITTGPGLLASRPARDALSKAEQVIKPGLHPAAHGTSLATAEEFGVSVYDARFLVIAQVLGARLVAEEAKLRRAAPALTQSLEEALA